MCSFNTQTTAIIFIKLTVEKAQPLALKTLKGRDSPVGFKNITSKCWFIVPSSCAKNIKAYAVFNLYYFVEKSF